MATTVKEFIEKAQNVNLYSRFEFRRLCQDLDVRNACGASRLCAIFPDEGVVLKVPRMNDCTRDYCALEVKNYENAKVYRVENILLPTEFVCETAFGCKIYKQPMYSKAFCNVSGKDYEVLMKTLHGLESKKIVTEIHCSVYDCRLAKVWTARVLQLYGKRFMRSFEKWTQFCEVNDLHDGNVGFLNGKPIILDYAGYFG